MPKDYEKYADSRSPEVKYAFLLPSLHADVRVETPTLKQSDVLSYAPAAYSAAKLLRYVRGLPLSEIEVECGAGVFTVYSGNDGKCKIAVKRFKTLSRDGHAEIYSTQIKVGCVSSPYGKVKLARVKSAVDFSDSVLRSLTLSRNGEEVIGAVAFSQDGNCVEAAFNFCKEGGGSSAFVAALSAASYISAGAVGSHGFSLKAGGETFDFLPLGGELLVCDRQDKPLTLYAPDI